MALDKNNKQPAYLCGRLFAVLERLQEDASGGKLDRTIKDAYFASAASKPAMVFPKLLRLAQNHLNKYESTALKSQYKRNFNRLIGEIVDKMGNEFPSLLSLTDQGKFMIGYYQQSQDFFLKHGLKENEEDK